MAEEAACGHLAAARPTQDLPPSVCTACADAGDEWVSLRLCLECGHVGCCDSSPNRHATGHFQETGHPVIQPLEKDADWMWCYKDEATLQGIAPSSGTRQAS